MTQLVLNDLINIDNFRSKYNKRVMARFNTDWSVGEQRRSYLDMYTNDPTLFRNWANSTYSAQHRTRESEQDLVLQFIKIQQPDLWLLTQAVNIQKKEGHTFRDPVFDYDDIWSANYTDIPELQKYVNLLVVKWKNFSRVWRYVDPHKVKSIPIYQILPKPYHLLDLEFPGFNKIKMRYPDLKRVINQPEWKQALSGVYGVYLITDLSNGQLYVGSAYGEDGVYGRWCTYLTSGYDKDENESGDYPNKRLRDLVRKRGIQYIKQNFQYSLLEIFPKNEMGKSNALTRENYWKEMVDSRYHGYNAN